MKSVKNKKRAPKPRRPKLRTPPSSPVPIPQSAELARIFVFDSIEACSGATAIPIRVIKFAKKSGAPAFEGSRIILGPLLRWLWARSESDEGIDWGERKEEYQAKREKIRLARDELSVIDKSDVLTALIRGMALLFDQLDRRFKLELPPALKGLAEPEIKSRLVAAAEELKTSFRASIESLLQEPPQSEDDDADVDPAPSPAK